MSVTLVWTQTDVDTLKAAVASGVLTVTYSGPPTRTVTYQNLPEMRAQLAQIVANANASTRRRFRLASTKKGL